MVWNLSQDVFLGNGVISKGTMVTILSIIQQMLEKFA